MHLPAAFRSLPRPSSPPGAKASPMRPYFASISFPVQLIIVQVVSSFFSSFWLLLLGSILPFYFFASLFLPVLSMNFLFPFTHFQNANQAVTRSILVEEYNCYINWTRTNLCPLWNKAPEFRLMLIILNSIHSKTLHFAVHNLNSKI